MPRLVQVVELAAAKKNPYVFSSHAAMSANIKAAAGQVGDYFDEIDSSLDKGSKIKKAVVRDKVAPPMRRLIVAARLNGFHAGAQVSKKVMPSLYGRDIRDAADRRSQKVDKLIRQATRRWLKVTPDSDYVLSGSRALAAAQYEAARAYFRGVKDALAGSGWGKQWITASNESCEDCMDNEDEGAIPVDQMFSSGDFYPAAHLHCMCMIEAVRL
ncbi:MAG: hypothetical protein KGL39_22150 [Patescibacteria group bacterium]|nr:hypothetical protein [Patescibacteria group bacterium]